MLRFTPTNDHRVNAFINLVVDVFTSIIMVIAKGVVLVCILAGAETMSEIVFRVILPVVCAVLFFCLFTGVLTSVMSV